jgi:hypothetical protein
MAVWILSFTFNQTGGVWTRPQGGIIVAQTIAFVKHVFG